MKYRPLVLLLLIALEVFICSHLSRHFLDIHFLLDDMTVYMETGLIALGMTFVIVCGEIDLSVASNLVLTACLTAKVLERWPNIYFGIAFACAAGSILGAFNGLLTTKLKVPSFLVTLGTMAAYRGAAQAMMGAGSVELPKHFKGLDRSWVVLPWPVIIFILCAIATGLLLHRTVFGRWNYAVGTNPSASRYSGIPVDWVKIAAFALTGLMCGIGALLLDSRLGVARYDYAMGLELDAITVVVVGGASIFGGIGTMLDTFVALVLIAIMRMGMNVDDVPPAYQSVAIGLILIVAVLAGDAADKLSERFTRAFRHN